jgi:protoporphyrinogen oxidase
MNRESFDHIVLGAGLRGLRAALQWRRTNPSGRQLVIEAQPAPGGSVRTQRTNGFVCELGPFAFAVDEIAPLLAFLPVPPPTLAALPTARSGWLRTASSNQPIEVTPGPVSFRSGTEELPQACRRELGDSLRLGRAATAIDHDGHAFVVTLDGQVPSQVAAAQLTVALPDRTAARLCTRFDPALGDVADRIQPTSGAFAFFGGVRADWPDLAGYGILPADDLESVLDELIFCSEVFPGRALPGRFLIRAELGNAPSTAADADLLAIAATEVRRWTGTSAPFGLEKLHRFLVEVPDGHRVECRQRLAALPARVRGLGLAPTT